MALRAGNENPLYCCRKGVCIMFDKNVVFTGKHAEYLRALAQGSSKPNPHHDWPFKMNYQVLMAAPVIGFLCHRFSPKDNDKNIQENKIFVEQLINNIDQLELIYRTIVLLAQQDSVSLDERMNRAFRYDRDEEKRSKGDEIFKGYVRGGIEVLYEQLIQGAETKSDDIQKLQDFVDLCDQFEHEDDPEYIYKFCREAGI